MDGPLADFDLHGWRVCRALAHAFDVPGPEHQTARYFTEHMPSKRDRAEARRIIESAGWFSDLPVVAGAQDGVQALVDAGVDVWVVTKPLEANPTCRDDKGAWLRRHFPDLERKLILAPDKSLIVGDVLLDDAPHLSWVDRALWRPVIFAAPFNGPGSEYGHLPRWTWGESIEALVRVAEEGENRER